MTDNKIIIECPACGKEMKKIFIEDAGVCVDICADGCGGIYFDNREFEKFDEPHENADQILAELEGKEFNKTDSREIRICPVCNVPMVKMGAGKAGVEIDVCNTCGAKFLDNGELEIIREGRKNIDEKAESLMYDIYNQDLKSMFGEKAGQKPRTGEIRKFFQKIVYDNITK